MARSEHKQSWHTAREVAPPNSDRPLPPADAVRCHCTDTAADSSATAVGGGAECPVSSHAGPPPQWWEICRGIRVFKVAGTGTRVMFTQWSLIRVLVKLRNGRNTLLSVYWAFDHEIIGSWCYPWRATRAMALQHNHLCGRHVHMQQPSPLTHALPAHCIS